MQSGFKLELLHTFIILGRQPESDEHSRFPSRVKEARRPFILLFRISYPLMAMSHLL